MVLILAGVISNKWETGFFVNLSLFTSSSTCQCRQKTDGVDRGRQGDIDSGAPWAWGWQARESGLNTGFDQT